MEYLYLVESYSTIRSHIYSSNLNHFIDRNKLFHIIPQLIN